MHEFVCRCRIVCVRHLIQVPAHDLLRNTGSQHGYVYLTHVPSTRRQSTLLGKREHNPGQGPE
jgi:hypothetical protein